MSIVWKAIMLLLASGIFPMCLGMWCTHWGKEKDGLILNYISGWLFILAWFEIFCVPMTLLGLPYHILRLVCHIFFSAMAAAAAIAFRHQLLQIIKRAGEAIKNVNFWGVIAAAAVAVQIFILVFYVHEDADDAFYVATAATTLKTDSMYRFSSYTGMPLNGLPMRYALSAFPIFTAYFAELIHIHPTITAHTIFPAVLIAVAYLIYYQMGKELTGDKRKAAFFVTVISFLNVFGNFSIYTSSSFLLFRIWQGKAILAAILIPAIFLFAFRIYERKENQSEWITMFLLMCSCCMVSSMGVVLGPLVLGAFSLAELIRTRKILTVLPAVVCLIPPVVLGGIYLIR